MAYELTGKVKLIQDPQTFASGFEKREIVVTVEDGKYPQDINVEFVQKSVPKLEGIGEGDTVTVTFDIRGREYNGRYFNNLVGWKIAVEGKEFKEDRPALPAEDAPADADSNEIPF